MKRLSAKTVAKLVRAVIRAWRISPRKINEGFCFNFARDLKDVLPGARIIWNDDYDHAYVRYGGRLYDAEAPEGVRRYTSLPCIKRQKC